MIKVNLQIKDNIYVFSIKGHANYAAIGNDIVCAGCSTLVNILLSGIQVYNIETPIVSIKENDVIIQIIENDDINVKKFISIIIDNFKIIEKQYPKNLDIKCATFIQ